MIPSRTRCAGAALLVAVLVLLALSPEAAHAAQTGPQQLGGQRLGRGYLHVFIAYAFAWALILGWVVSIARRLARVEDRLEREG